jgi:hypothetical protein
MTEHLRKWPARLAARLKALVTIRISFAAALVLAACSALGGGESPAALHNQPIYLRILDGVDGHPLAHAHLRLVGGYNQRDFQLEMWRQEALSDDHGWARLPDALASLPFLEVMVAGKHLCLGDSHAAGFSVERIRRDGLSTANRCGTATMEDAPGVFTVWVKGTKAAGK